MSVLVFSAGPANGAGAISARLSMRTTATTTSGVVSVDLPMSQHDAQGYINNGARIEVRCYGDDYFFDDQLFPTRTFTRTTGTPPSQADRLWADQYGVHLFTDISFARGAEYNEDLAPDNGDEVYCKGTWIDGDGAVLSAFTTVARGTF
ncbi:hypothetical protein [Kribbella ginsengisoli]